MDGVKIDLCHEDFDTKHWKLPSDLFLPRELCSGGPKLVFPWTELSDSVDLQGDGPHSTPDANNLAATDNVILEQGDRLYIHHVELISNNDILRGCNLPRKYVYFAVKRNNGESIRIETPLLMVPKNELWEKDFVVNYYSAIKGRIINHFGLDDLASYDGIQNDGSFAYRALRKINLLLRSHGLNGLEAPSDARQTVVLPTWSSEESHENSNVWFTINDAVALGYLWAKSEDERNWAPFRGSIIPQQSVAAHVSVSVRRKRADDWKQVYQERLAEIWVSATKKPTRSKMIDLVISDQERWDATKSRLNLPGATMRGRSSLEKAMMTKRQLNAIAATRR